MSERNAKAAYKIQTSNLIMNGLLFNLPLNTTNKNCERNKTAKNDNDTAGAVAMKSDITVGIY